MSRAAPRSLPAAPAGVLLLLLALLLSAVAIAHPYGPRYYSLRSELRLGAEGLQATVVLEIPTMKVLREFARMYGHLDELGSEQDEAYRDLQFQRLREGLELRIDDRPISGTWAPAAVPINGKGGEDFFIYILTFDPTEPLRTQPGSEVVIQNDSFPGVPMYYSAYAHAEAGWRVQSNSVADLLGEASALEDVSENPAGWTRDASARTFRARFERAAAP